MNPHNPHELAAPQSRGMRVFLIVAPPLVWCAFLILFYWRRGVFFVLTDEDGVVENIQAILLVAACGLSFASAWTFKRARHYVLALLYVGLAFLLFTVAGEEISWGQRIIGIATPERLQRENKQQEINFHNLRSAEKFMRVGTNTVAWLLVLESLCARKLARSFPSRMQPYAWLPDPILLPCWLCYLAYKIARSHAWARHWNPAESRLQEPSEMVLYFGVFAFLLLVWLRSRGADFPKSREENRIRAKKFCDAELDL